MCYPVQNTLLLEPEWLINVNETSLERCSHTFFKHVRKYADPLREETCLIIRCVEFMNEIDDSQTDFFDINGFGVAM